MRATIRRAQDADGVKAAALMARDEKKRMCEKIFEFCRFAEAHFITSNSILIARVELNTHEMMRYRRYIFMRQSTGWCLSTSLHENPYMYHFFAQTADKTHLLKTKC